MRSINAAGNMMEAIRLIREGMRVYVDEIARLENEVITLQKQVQALADEIEEMT